MVEVKIVKGEKELEEALERYEGEDIKVIQEEKLEEVLKGYKKSGRKSILGMCFWGGFVAPFFACMGMDSTLDYLSAGRSFDLVVAVAQYAGIIGAIMLCKSYFNKYKETKGLIDSIESAVRT